MSVIHDGNDQVESVYYAGNIKSAVKGISCCEIIGHFNIIKQLF